MKYKLTLTTEDGEVLDQWTSINLDGNRTSGVRARWKFGYIR